MLSTKEGNQLIYTYNAVATDDVWYDPDAAKIEEEDVQELWYRKGQNLEVCVVVDVDLDDIMVFLQPADENHKVPAVHQQAGPMGLEWLTAQPIQL